MLGGAAAFVEDAIRQFAPGLAKTIGPLLPGGVRLAGADLTTPTPAADSLPFVVGPEREALEV